MDLLKDHHKLIFLMLQIFFYELDHKNFYFDIIKLTSSKISLVKSIDPITDCSASILFGNSSALFFNNI